MLWEKESNQSDALYVDLLRKLQFSMGSFRIHPKKDNILSKCARSDGNKKITAGDFKSAMKLYNESIRFAEDSEHLSLSYANRSFCCFFLNNSNS